MKSIEGLIWNGQNSPGINGTAGELIWNPTNMTLDSARQYFERENLKLASAPDIYNYLKDHELKLPLNKLMHTDSRAVYYSDVAGGFADIYHSPTSEPYSTATVPYWGDKNIETALAEHNTTTEEFLQKIFATEDSAKEIIRVLGNISQGKRILLATSIMANAKSAPVRPIILCNRDSYLHVSTFKYENPLGPTLGVKK